MQIETIGVAAVMLGLIGWIAGQRFAIPLFLASTLLSAAAAFVLSSLGGATIQPAHLLLGFLVVPAVLSRASLRRAGAALLPPNAGFWLLLTAVYAVLSAYFLPRIFAGATYVFAIARTELGPGVISMPLAPTSGNITQATYFLGDLACFLCFFDAASRPGGMKSVTAAALAAAAINLCFAAIDIGTYRAGLSDVLGAIRNANYRMLDDATVLGFKRIVGSFPEASTFAYFTAGFFAFCTKLWLDGVRARLAAPLALLSLLALVFATSSTGYVATAGFLSLLFIASLAHIVKGKARRSTFVLATVFPILIAGGVIGLRLDGALWRTASQVVEVSLFDKMNSSSGVERGKWNDQALINFADTGGLGAGNGSVRASSFPLALLGNIGIPGTVTYGLFLFGVLFGRKDRWRHPYPAGCQSAARWACLTQLIGASVAGSFIDLGLPFFIFAGVACAGPEAGADRAARAAAPAQRDGHRITGDSDESSRQRATDPCLRAPGTRLWCRYMAREVAARRDRRPQREAALRLFLGGATWLHHRIFAGLPRRPA
jgi:hypothetical protein